MTKEAIDVDETLKGLYKKWPDIKRYLKTLGCGSSDADDIFQEALLIFIRKIEEPTFELNVAPFHYVKNTCKFLWYNQSRRQAKHQKVEVSENLEDFESDWFKKELKFQQIEHAVSQIGKQCQQILQLFYGLGLSMIEVAKKLGIRNGGVAKTQKYRCLNKVKDIVRSNSITL
ncbi:MAG: RNA polymerase sigma factor [Crocinitomicaceae bacterium]